MRLMGYDVSQPSLKMRAVLISLPKTASGYIPSGGVYCADTPVHIKTSAIINLVNIILQRVIIKIFGFTGDIFDRKYSDFWSNGQKWC